MIATWRGSFGSIGFNLFLLFGKNLRKFTHNQPVFPDTDHTADEARSVIAKTALPTACFDQAVDYCGEMMVDAATANVVADDSVRPGGTAVEVRAATVGHAVGVTDANGSTIRLTEYPDCDANATYFRILDPAVAEPDPLFTGSAR